MTPRCRLVVFMVAATMLSVGALAQAVRTEPVTVPLRFDRYYTYEQVGEALRALNKAYPAMTTLEVVGKSDEGRDIWAMTVNNPKTGAPEGKPGVYVDANIHGNEIQGTEVALYLLNTLLGRYGENEQITKAVDRNVFYVVPSVNVDGRAHFLSDPNNPSSDRTFRVPRDDDRDGLVDEDGPDDLDGDGNITTMRKRDPFGQWKTDPEDPRLLVRVKPGEQGEWTMLGSEGLDNDGDGLVNEDGPGYLDGNRNWGIHWEPPYVQSGAGDYPFQASGTRAIARWLVARPNIIMVFAFHNNGGMYLRGPSAKAGEPMHPKDVAVYDVLGQNAEKIVPGYRYLISWKDLYTTYGDFTDFTDNVLAAYGFVGELFVTGSETYRKPGQGGAAAEGQGDEGTDIMGGNLAQDRERLLFNDNVVQGDLYKAWKPFTHPQYGEIEIGGWVKMSSRLPHPFMLPDLVHRNASAVIFAASETPDVSLEILGAERIGTGLSRVRVRLANKGVMPTLSFAAVQKKTHPLDTLKVSGAGLTVVSGGVLTDIYRDLVAYKANRPEVQLLQVPGSSKVDYQFLVSGTGTLTVTYHSTKAGTRTATVEIR
jgi:hypothetical protein